MSEILLLLFLGLLLFGGVVWLVRKLAELWHAERAGYGPATVATGASLVLGLLLQLLLATMFSPWALVIVTIAADAWIFSLLLGTSLLRGLGVTVIINIAATALIILLFFLLFSLGLGGRLVSDSMTTFSDGSQQQRTIEGYADAVCSCGTDKGCLQERYAEVIFAVAREMERDPGSDAQAQLYRAQHCVTISNQTNNRTGESTIPPPSNTAPPPNSAPSPPAKIDSGLSSGGPNTTNAPPTTTFPTAAPQDGSLPAISITIPHQSRWQFDTVPLASIDQYIHQRVRVTRADNGKVIEGRLMPSQQANAIALEQQRYGGVFVMQIPKRRIRNVEVRYHTAP